MKLISNSVFTFGNCTCTQVSAPEEEKPPSFLFSSSLLFSQSPVSSSSSSKEEVFVRIKGVFAMDIDVNGSAAEDTAVVILVGLVHVPRIMITPCPSASN